jgi:predicted Zn-dependent peptidase
MKRTFKSVEHSGRVYNFLALPGTNYFSYEIVSLLGASIERDFNNNVYGLSHLCEHLSFRATKDYTTEELNKLIKQKGSYNASTSHERINYYFKTISDNAPLAIRLVCNYALNDLTKIPQEEFEIEKMVVYNEAKRYADDDQTMFHFNVPVIVTGCNPEDNVIGVPETIESFTLCDAIALKATLIEGRKLINIIYDPEKYGIYELIDLSEKEIARFDVIDMRGKWYNDLELIYGAHKLENESEQAMTAIIFDVDPEVSMINRKLALRYLARMASGSSLDDLIREQNGLTYGISLSEELIGEEMKTEFVCDVTRGKEKLMLKLFKQAINKTYKEFTEKKYEELIESIVLKTTEQKLSQLFYAQWFTVFQYNKELFELVRDKLEVDVDLVQDEIYNKIASFSEIKKYLKFIKDTVAKEDYAIVANYNIKKKNK